MTTRRRIVSATCCAIAAALLLWAYLKPPDRGDLKAVSNAEDEVYEVVVREIFTPTNGQKKISKLVFSDTADGNLCPGVDVRTCEDGVRKRLLRAAGGGLRMDTIEDFIRNSRTKVPLSKTFYTDLPRTFIDPDSIYFDLVPVQKSGKVNFDETFAGAAGMISLSRVGFDATLHEAIVSSSFVCGGLCGTGRRHILRKKWGKWVVVDTWIVWVS